MRQGQAYRFVSAGLIAPCLLLLFSAASSLAAPAPHLPDGSLSLKKTSLSIGYNPEHKQADFVFYPLSRRELRNCVGRKNNFRPDPTLSSDTAAQLSDYSGSGYDRGHLSPAADNKWSAQAMSESFLLSNISPQPPRFNQGIWGRLENLVRAWAMKGEGLWVTTGPVLHSQLPTIGENRVSVPEYFYKVLLTKDANPKALALLLPTTANENLQEYAISIDELERMTGLNFLQDLDPRAEDQLEAEVNLHGWDFRARYNSPPCKSGMELEAFFFGDVNDFYPN